MTPQNWLIYTGGEPHDGVDRLPEPPNWRQFDGGPVCPLPREKEATQRRRLGDRARQFGYRPDPFAVKMINAALYLRRPLLVTGRPGSGKSSLADAVARELQLGPVLRWSITSRSTLQDALYQYDPIGRLRDENLRHLRAQSTAGSPDSTTDETTDKPADADRVESSTIGRYLRLGPLGTALLPYEKPRVLLVDEIDKSDIDLPNDLLNVFEEGEFDIPELVRLAQREPDVQVMTADDGGKASIHRGRVRCRAFPFVLLTSNGEREFPPAFLRRCLRLDLPEPDADQLAAIVEAHLGPELAARSREFITQFVDRRAERRAPIAVDQLLGALYLRFSCGTESDASMTDVIDAVLRSLDSSGAR